jgi:hypothetical protein
MPKSSLCLALVIAAIPGPLAGQVRVEFSPQVGVFTAATDLPDDLDASCGCSATLKQATSFALGGRLSLWLTSRLAIEGNVQYSSSRLLARPKSITLPSDDAHVLASSARILLSVLPGSLPLSFHLSGGGGVVSHGGKAYDGVRGTNDFGVAAGAGFRFPISETVSLRADVDGYHYTAQFYDNVGHSTPSRSQTDIWISIGLTGAWGDD